MSTKAKITKQAHHRVQDNAMYFYHIDSRFQTSATPMTKLSGQERNFEFWVCLLIYVGPGLPTMIF